MLRLLLVLGCAGETTDTADTAGVVGDATVGAGHFTDTCAGCHGAQGDGAEAPALNNQVLLASATATYLL